MRVQPDEGSLPRARLDQVPVPRSLFSPPCLCVHYPRRKHSQFNEFHPPFTLLHSFIVLILIFNCIFTWSSNTTLICILANILCIRSRRTRATIRSFPACPRRTRSRSGSIEQADYGSSKTSTPRSTTITTVTIAITIQQRERRRRSQ